MTVGGDCYVVGGDAERLAGIPDGSFDLDGFAIS